MLPQRLTEVTGPLLGDSLVGPTDHDLTVQHDVEPLGQRIIVKGRVLDTSGTPLPHTLVEIWQANASGATGTPVTTGRRHWIPASPGSAGR